MECKHKGMQMQINGFEHNWNFLKALLYLIKTPSWNIVAITSTLQLVHYSSAHELAWFV